MKLTAKEIKEQKEKFGSKAVNTFVLYMAMKQRLKYLPDSFILNVINSSEPLPVDQHTTTRINRKDKRQIQKQLVNSSIASYRRKQ